MLLRTPPWFGRLIHPTERVGCAEPAAPGRFVGLGILADLPARSSSSPLKSECSAWHGTWPRGRTGSRRGSWLGSTASSRPRGPTRAAVGDAIRIPAERTSRHRLASLGAFVLATEPTPAVARVGRAIARL